MKVIWELYLGNWGLQRTFFFQSSEFRYQLESMLNLAKCEIISSMTNSEIDAYVLSESSLFVSKRRIILKTCGTTTPLDCIERIIWLVQKYTQYDMVEDIYYSRKNFKRPFLQHKQHKSFENEVRLLDKFFQEDGAAYCMGTINKDCWFMYTLNPMERWVSLMKNEVFVNLSQWARIFCWIMLRYFHGIPHPIMTRLKSTTR